MRHLGVFCFGLEFLVYTYDALALALGGFAIGDDFALGGDLVHDALVLGGSCPWRLEETLEDYNATLIDDMEVLR